MTAAALSTRNTAAAAFLLPALALWLPSGYSYAALLLLGGAVCFAPATWLRRPPDRATLGLGLLMLAMGCLAYLLALEAGVAAWDKAVKWYLGALCLMYVTASPPPLRAFVAGLPLGCAGMGLQALWQVGAQGLERATGYTNAIQWGNLALLLACLAAVPLAVYWRQHRWPWRVGMGLAVALGFSASLLSQSRGGWLAVVAVFPLWLWLVWRLRPERFGRVLAALAVALVALVLVLSFTPRFKDRVELAAAEISGFMHQGQENTSLGLRLAQYELVAQLIPQKPWLGWSAHGFVGEMQRRVDAGEYVPTMMHYPEVHNIFLDGWVKVGVGGALLPAALFAWVLAMFWPSRERMARHAADSPVWRDVLALRVMGTTVPACYVVFGMSQPFFNHNSGIMCFVFYVAVLWAALQGLERGR